MSASTLRMLTNVRSCLNQKPESNCCATTPVASPRCRGAQVLRQPLGRGRHEFPRQEGRQRERNADADHRPSQLQQDAPEARITVHSELPTSWAMANSVPISAATGKSSYRRDGTLQRDEQDGGGQRVVALADVLHFVDEVEEGEQHQQRREDQQRREQHIAADVACERAHVSREGPPRPADRPLGGSERSERGGMFHSRRAEAARAGRARTIR